MARWLVATLLAAALAVSAAQAKKRQPPQPPAPIMTGLAVHQLAVFTFENIPAAVLQERLAPGYALKPCFGAAGYSAHVVVSEQVLLDAPFVAVPSHSLAVLTCAIPPAGYAHPDPIGEEDWYALYLADDLDESQQALLTQYGSRRDRLTFTWAPIDDLSFSFVARLSDALGLDNIVVASGAIASPGLPVPEFGLPCVPAPSQGRTLQPNPAARLTFALDFAKTEAICAGSGRLHWDGSSPLQALLGQGQFRAVTISGRVADAVNTYFAIPE